MLQEGLDFLFHYYLAPKYLVKLGLVQEVIGIKYRQKRQEKAWLEHREKSKTQILEAVSKLPNKRKALIIGAGLLLDLPYKELDEQFDEVIFVDIFFMQEAINEIKLLKNARFEQIDISSTLREAYYLWQNHGQGKGAQGKKDFDSKLRNLLHKKPNHFLLEENLDYVLSCNLLSQLSIAFDNYSEKKKMLKSDTLKAFIDSFEANHIEYLKAFPKHTKVHLLTDTEKIVYDKNKVKLESLASVDPDLLTDFKLKDSWLWNLADYGELERDYALKLKVDSYLLN